MVRDLNNTVLAKVATLLPDYRMGPTGDGPKLYCATCHRGAQKPLNGYKLVEFYPELRPPLANEEAAVLPHTGQ